MAGLSHYNSAKASTQKYEPIFLNQFEVTITPPASITVPAGASTNNILLEQVKKLSGFAPDINPGEVAQKYKNAKRFYAGAAPMVTGFDLGISFEINLDSNNSMYAFKVLRQWSDLIYNPLTGGQGLKKDYTGQIVIRIFNKAGDVFREVTCLDVFPMTAITPLALNYTNTNVYSIEDLKFAVDVFNDVWI